MRHDGTGRRQAERQEHIARGDRSPPEDASYEEILRELAFERMVERGLADARSGRSVGHDEALRRKGRAAPAARQTGKATLTGDDEMTDEGANYDLWYRKPLERLLEDPDAGFAIQMVAFPLLERYLRQKHEISETAEVLGDPKRVWPTLRKVVPELADVDQAVQFWGVFRNGVVHTASMSHITRKGKVRPDGCILKEIEHTAVWDRGENRFLINPYRFARSVLDQIDQDFDVFIKGGMPFPTESPVRRAGEPNPYWGTTSKRT